MNYESNDEVSTSQQQINTHQPEEINNESPPQPT